MFKFGVEGDFCHHCMEEFIEKANKMDGVKNISFNIATEKVNLELNNEDRKDIIDTLKKLFTEMESTAKLVEENEDEEEGFYSKKISLKEIIAINREDIIKIVISLALFAATFGVGSERVKFYLYLIAIFVLGYELFINSIKNILAKNFLDENFLMSIAAICAFLIGEYVEAIFVLVLYTLGEIFENLTTNNTKYSITKLMDLKEDFSNLVVDDEIKKVKTEDVKIGQVIRIKPYEKVPLDSVIISGSSMMDTSSITGESIPVLSQAGDEILSGYINGSNVIDCKVEKEFSDSTVSKILDMVQNATEKKSEAEKFITKFAKYYTPVVVIIAIMIASIPPLLGFGEFRDFLYRALAFLVVSCPCAIVISVPLAYFAGLGKASKSGVLIKGNNYLEALNNISEIAFDKTGTITKGKFGISEIVSESDMKESEILSIIALAEHNSNHPIARAVLDGYGEKLDINRVSNFEEIPGTGIKCSIDGREIIAGNRKIFDKYNIRAEKTPSETKKTVIYLTIDNDYKGYVTLEDEIKDSSKDAIAELKNKGIKTILLTGDKESVADDVTKKVGIDYYRSDLLPDEKVIELEKIIEKAQKNVVFIGDGINDAPSLKRADIGVSMGEFGQDSAIVASDIVLMTDDIKSFVKAIDIAKHTQKIVKQNIYFSIGAKVLIMLLSALGITSLWLAVFGDVGVAMLAILNSSRISRTFD